MPPGLAKAVTFQNLGHDVLELILKLAYQDKRILIIDNDEYQFPAGKTSLGSHALVLDQGHHADEITT